MKGGLKTDCRYSSKADFIAKEVKATNTVLSILVVVILDEAEAMNQSVMLQEDLVLLTLCTGQSSCR